MAKVVFMHSISALMVWVWGNLAKYIKKTKTKKIRKNKAEKCGWINFHSYVYECVFVFVFKQTSAFVGFVAHF